MESDTGTQDPAPEVPASMPDMSRDKMIEDLRSSGMPMPATVNFGNFTDVDSGTVACANHNDEATNINVFASFENNFNSEESIPCAAGPLNVGPNASTHGAFAMLQRGHDTCPNTSRFGSTKRNTIQQQFFWPLVL